MRGAFLVAPKDHEALMLPSILPLRDRLVLPGLVGLSSFSLTFCSLIEHWESYQGRLWNFPHQKVPR